MRRELSAWQSVVAILVVIALFVGGAMICVFESRWTDVGAAMMLLGLVGAIVVGLLLPLSITYTDEQNSGRRS
jgi:hypothetical protein